MTVEQAPRAFRADAMMAEISRVIGCEVELIVRQAAGDAVFMVVPVDRQRLRSGFWEAVRLAPCAGLWRSPEAALVGFSTLAIGWMKLSRHRSASAVDRFVREQLGQARSAPARRVITAGRSAGISPAALHRAAARLGVRRQKISMTEGWLWTLPPEGEANSSIGASDE